MARDGASNAHQRSTRSTGHRRADWRLLLPTHPHAGVALIGLGSAADWAWLVEDGWVDRVAAELPAPDGADRFPAPDGADRYDAIVIGPGHGADPTLVDRSVRALTPDGAVLVLGGRRHRRMVRALRRRGAGSIRRYLAIPDAATPERLIPLDHPGGLAWLAGPRPALDAVVIPRRRRLLRRAMRRLAGPLPEPFGEVVIVASRLTIGVVDGSSGGAPAPSPTPPSPAAPPLAAQLLGSPVPSGGPGHGRDAVLVTSGFDEGSRTVVLPLGPDDRPDAVVKVVARPAYLANARREHELLVELATRVTSPGLVPEPIGSVNGGPVAAVVESYAGRWTASAVLNEQRTLDRRRAVLTVVGGRISDLSRTGRTVETWNADGFESLLGRWFDELDDRLGPSPLRRDLRAALWERSVALDGRPLPFGLRHFDLGPWNVVFADRRAGGPGVDGRGGPDPSPVAVVDWELAPPRTRPFGVAGADHLYFAKYWLHIALATSDLDQEGRAFTFLGPSTPSSSTGSRRRLARPIGPDPRVVAREAVGGWARDLGLDRAFLPLVEAHVWSEAACATIRRRQDQGGGDRADGGRPLAYLDVVARHRDRLLETWPL